MSSRESTPLVVVDWGSTRLRLWLVESSSGRALASVSRDAGVGVIQAGQHEDVFRALLADLIRDLESTPPRLSVFCAGMVTSTLGWRETGYVRAPVTLGDLDRRAERVALAASEGIPALELRFYPGVRTETDVMRGEEMQVFACLDELDPRGASELTLVLPGTHSKWVRCAPRSAALLDFVTAPTGDLFAALHRDTLLSRTLPDAPWTPSAGELDFFELGVETTCEEGSLAALFHVRSRAVLDVSEFTPLRCSAFLSGALLAAEILERVSRRRAASRAIVLGDRAIRELYERAGRVLSRKGVEVEIESAAVETGDSLCHIAAQLLSSSSS